jgi:MFS family permease
MGGTTGIQILQWTQLITILGGGAGYFLCANTFTNHLVTAEERTASFGQSQGFALLGTAFGFTCAPSAWRTHLIERSPRQKIVGGFFADHFGTIAIFKLVFVLFVISTLISTFFLPYIAPPVPPSTVDGDGKATPKQLGFFSFLAPLSVFSPRRIPIEEGGNEKRFYGLMLLGIAVFLGTLAVAFVPFLLQLTATNSFGFHASEVRGPFRIR